MDKKSLWICLGLFVVSLVVGYGTFLIVDVFREKNENLIDNTDIDNNVNDDVVSDEFDDDFKPATEVYNKVLHYSGNYLDISDEVIEFDNNNDYKDKLLTLTVDNIKIDGKEYTFSWKNHPQDCISGYDYMREGYNEFYINDKLFYFQSNEACYLERAYYITIINDKYIGVTFEGQMGNRMYVFDKNINLVDQVYFYKIDIKKDGIYFSQYADESGCILNNYVYDIVDGETVKIFKNMTNNNVCDEMYDKGCNCSTDNSKGIKFELDKEKEKIKINDLILDFNGVKTGETDYQMVQYQYTLDISLNGKKIDALIFSNKDDKVIWFSNCAAYFEVYQLDNYYILKSVIAKQNDGSYVLIIDKDGKILKTFNDVAIKIDDRNLSVEVTDCVSNDVLANCSSHTYKLSELK